MDIEEIVGKLSPEALEVALAYDKSPPDIQEVFAACLGAIERGADSEAVVKIIESHKREEITCKEAVARFNAL